MTRKVLGLAVSFALFPKPLTLAHAAGAALVFGAGAAHTLLRPPAGPIRADAVAEDSDGKPEGLELLPPGAARV